MAYKTITLLGDPIRMERVAIAAFSPGFLVEIDSAGGFVKHNSAGATAATMFALEDENQGKDIDDAYVAATQALVGFFRPGNEVYAQLANGETAVIGTLLESNGDGYLRAVDADTSIGLVGIQSVVGIALEALDMSGSSGVDPSSQFIRVLVI